MIRHLLAGAAALGMIAGVATAQTSTSTATTVVTPQVSSPVTVTTTTGHAFRPDGTKTVSNGALARDTTGNVNGGENSATNYPFSNLLTTTQKKVEMVNGRPVETVTTTHAYPPTATIPPATTTTQTNKIDIK